MIYKLYVDMDGVLTDFVGGYRKMTRYHFEHYAYIHGVDKAWDRINENEYRFWSNLKWTPWGKNLWNNIREYNPMILTSPGMYRSETMQAKKDWCFNNLGQDAEIYVDIKKNEYADAHSILIDDSYKQRKLFKRDGGETIAVYDKTSAKHAVRELKSLLRQGGI